MTGNNNNGNNPSQPYKPEFVIQKLEPQGPNEFKLVVSFTTMKNKSITFEYILRSDMKNIKACAGMMVGENHIESDQMDIWEQSFRDFLKNVNSVPKIEQNQSLNKNNESENNNNNTQPDNNNDSNSTHQQVHPQQKSNNSRFQVQQVVPDSKIQENNTHNTQTAPSIPSLPPQQQQQIQQNTAITTSPPNMVQSHSFTSQNQNILPNSNFSGLNSPHAHTPAATNANSSQQIYQHLNRRESGVPIDFEQNNTISSNGTFERELVYSQNYPQNQPSYQSQSSFNQTIPQNQGPNNNNMFGRMTPINMMLMQQQNNIYNDMQNLLAIQDQKRQTQEQMFKIEQAHLLERLKNPRPASSFANNPSQAGSGLEFDLGMPISYNSLDNNTARMLAEEIRAYNIREQAKEEAKKLYEDKMLAFERKLEEMRREKETPQQQESSTIEFKKPTNPNINNGIPQSSPIPQNNNITSKQHPTQSNNNFPNSQRQQPATTQQEPKIVQYGSKFFRVEYDQDGRETMTEIGTVSSRNNSNNVKSSNNNIPPQSFQNLQNNGQVQLQTIWKNNSYSQVSENTQQQQQQHNSSQLNE